MSSDRDRAIAGEEVQNFQSFIFPATSGERNIRFMDRRIQVYHETTFEYKVNKDSVYKNKVCSPCWI
jgi:hypothetical protein